MKVENYEIPGLDWFDSGVANIMFSPDMTAVRHKNTGETALFSKNYIVFGPDRYVYGVYHKLLSLNFAGIPARWKKAMYIKTPEGLVRAYWRKDVNDWYQKITIGDKTFTSKFDYRYKWPVFIAKDHLVYVGTRGMRVWATNGLHSPWKRSNGVYEIANYHLIEEQKLLIFTGSLEEIKSRILGTSDAQSSYVIKSKVAPVEIIDNAYMAKRDKNGVPEIIKV